MGGGFGGCVVGFVKHNKADAATTDIRKAYRQLHPEVADQARQLPIQFCAKCAKKISASL
jgi:galactokinase